MLINRYVLLALTILGPLIVNILLYHLPLNHEGAALAIIVAILWRIAAYRQHQHFSG